MATQAQEEAQTILLQLSQISPLKADAVLEALTTALPNWKADGGGHAGYSNDPLCDTAIAVARALHAGLPVPFNMFPFDWTKSHCLGTVVIYLSQPLDGKVLSSWIANAMAQNAAIMENR